MNNLWRAVLGLFGFLVGCVLLGLWYWLEESGRAGQRAVEKKQWAKALTPLRRYLWLHPSDVDANMHMAQALTSTQACDEALTYLARIPDEHPRGGEARLRQAEVLFQCLKRAGRAEVILRRILELDPQNVDACRVLLYLFRFEGREEDARSITWQAYDSVDVDNRHRILATWFLVQYARIDIVTAVTELRAYIEADENDVSAKVALAQLHAQNGEPENGRKILEELALPPEHLEGRANLIELHMHFGDSDQAGQLLDEWPMDGRDARYWRLRGIHAQEHRADFSTAIEALGKSLEFRPYDFELYHRLSLCLRGQGNIRAADAVSAESERIRQFATRPVVQQMIDEVIPKINTLSSCWRMAEYHDNLHCWREARCWYTEVLRFDPKHAEALAALKIIAEKEAAWQAAPVRYGAVWDFSPRAKAKEKELPLKNSKEN